MKKKLVSVAIVAVLLLALVCATGARRYKAEPGRIIVVELYSGGQIVRVWWTQLVTVQAGVAEFAEIDTPAHPIVRVSGTYVVTEMDVPQIGAVAQ